YAHGVDNTVAKTTTYYVSYVATEQISKNQCESPKTEVKVIVNQLPDVSITVPAIVCQTAGDVVIPKTEKSYNGNGSGVWSIVGETAGISSSGVFNSEFKGETTGIYTVDYTYTDAKGCVNNDQGDVLVQFTEPPTTEGHTSITELNEPVVIKANTLAGATVNWYKEKTAGVSLSTQNPWTTDDNPLVEIEKSYWASQTVHGCESKRTQAFVSIIDCPVPAPTIASNLVQACLLEPMPTLEASGTETIRWYAANDLIQYVHEGSTYQPTISTTGLHEFYISQYDGTCEGLRVKITVQVLETPKPGIIGNKTICDYEDLTLTALTSTGTVYWYESDPKTATAVGTGNTYTISSYAAGVHSIWAIHENTCFSEPVEISITVNEQPTAPTLSGDNVCEGETIGLQAVGNTIQWYEDGNTTTIGTGNSINISSKPVGNYKFEATQTVLGCTSDKSFIDVTVHDIPESPIVNSDEICSNEEMISFVVQGLPTGEINWYSDENCTALIATTVHTYTPTTNGTQTVYVTQTVHNCTSQATSATITVHEQPKLVKFQHANNIEICEKSEQALIVTENNNIKWYDSETATTPIQIGRFLNKTYTEVGTFTYYATQTVNNCESEKNSTTVTVFSGPQPPSIVTNNLTLCEKTETGILEVSKNSPNETIVWTKENGESITLGTTLQVPIENSPIGFTRVYAHTAVSGCSEPSDKIPLTYQIVSQPNAPNVKQSQFCFTGTSIMLEVEKGVNVSWYDANQTKISQCENQNTCTPEIYAQGSYIFYVNQTVNNCESPMKEVQINIHPIPNPIILGATELCEKTTKTYAIQHASTNNTYEWDITGGHLSYEIAQAGITGHSRTFDFNKSGLDTITVRETNSYNCSGTAKLPITIAPIPQVFFTTENPGQEGLIRITNESKPQIVEKGETRVEIPVNYYWDFGTTYTDTTFIQNEKTIDVQYKYGNYVIHLEAIDDFGCRNTYSEDIFVAISYRLFIPNAFSPGNPAKGVRTFKPIGYNLESFKMWIFDQWGNIIWYSAGVTDNGSPIGEWDGKYNGISLPSGAYIWKIEAVFADGTMWYDKKNNGKHTQFGTVNIIK
ncbi:MAG: gliding motility-associated C-terminal domain-containing protein, partial [Bacteroidales bacterium]|nr:gliding motility-associated C-terminal domain-containing protein [Bacteroidales bacterium]NLK81311.1 hypothetical protein [Bacteroidales bacterium]